MLSPASELLAGIVTLFVSFEAILWLISTLGVPLFLAGFFCSHYSSTFMQITGCCCLFFSFLGIYGQIAVDFVVVSSFACEVIWMNWKMPFFAATMNKGMQNMRSEGAPIAGYTAAKSVENCLKGRTLPFINVKWRFTDSKGSRRLKNLSTKRICALFGTWHSVRHFRVAKFFEWILSSWADCWMKMCSYTKN